MTRLLHFVLGEAWSQEAQEDQAKDGGPLQTFRFFPAGPWQLDVLTVRRLLACLVAQPRQFPAAIRRPDLVPASCALELTPARLTP